MFTPVIVILLFLYLLPEVKMEDQCSVSPPRIILNINSRRNKTGYWLAQVGMQHGADYEEEYGKDTGHWNLDVAHSTDRCGGAERIHVTATITVPPTRAGPNYEFIPGFGYYKFYNKGTKWEDARKACIQDGAHLLIINSEEESKVIQQLFVNNPTRDNASNRDFAMVGFHDRFTEGQYTTIFGEPLASTGFIRWSHAGQPDNGHIASSGDPDSDCGAVHANGGLNDVPCSYRLAFICEQELW